MASNSGAEGGAPPPPAEAQPPYILAFDMDDTIIGKMPRPFAQKIVGKKEFPVEWIEEMKPNLIKPIVDILLRAGELRSRGIVKAIYLITNNRNLGYTSGIDSILYEMLGIPSATEDGFYGKDLSAAGVQLPKPKFFDAILMQQDSQRYPSQENWSKNPKNWILPEFHPNGRRMSNLTAEQLRAAYSYKAPPYNPSKSMRDIRTLAELTGLEGVDLVDLNKHVLFFDDFPRHKFIEELSPTQYIVIHPGEAALHAELEAKVPEILRQPKGSPVANALPGQEGGRRRRRNTKTKKRTQRRRTTHKKSKVYARRR